MADPAGLDMAEVVALADALGGIKGRIGTAMRKATATSAERVQTLARTNIRAQTRGGYTRKYPSSINYSIVKSNSITVIAEIGPQIRRKPLQGFLGHILEYGTAHNAPKPHLNPALDTEDPKYVEGMADAGENSVLG